MPKSQPRAKVHISITLNPQIAVWIERLLDSGTYGETRADVAQRLIVERLIEMLNEPQRKVKPWSVH